MDMEDGHISLSNNAPFDSLESYFKYLSEMKVQNYATNSEVNEDMAEEISINSHHLKTLSFQAEKVVDEISSDVKDLSARSRDMAKHLRDLSSEAGKILEIKIENGVKRDLVEKRKEKVIEDMAEGISMNSHHLKSLSFQVEKVLQIKIERQAKRDLLEERSEKQVVDEMSSDVKELSARSRDMEKHLRDLSSEAGKILEIKIENGAKRELVEKRKEKVIEDMAEEISINSHHLKSISCQSEKMLQIKIEHREKRDLLEERNEKVLKDVATYLKEMSTTSQKREQLKNLAYRAEKGEDSYLKNCQSLLSDFVFFMLSLIPWLLYYNVSDNADDKKKTPPPEYFHLLFFVSAFAFLGMFGFALSHIARKSWWVYAVYVITATSVMATIGLVGYALFHIIPAEHEYYHSARYAYLIVYVIIGSVLLGAWWHNFNSP